MKCETSLSFLEEYLDGELAREDVERVEAHLVTCVECKNEFAMLSAEQDMFARYDRELEVPQSLWTSVAAEIVPAGKPSVPSLFERLAGLFQIPSVSFAGAVAVLLIALIAGAVYVYTKQSGPSEDPRQANTPVKKNVVPDQKQETAPQPQPKREDVVADNSTGPSGTEKKQQAAEKVVKKQYSLSADQSDVIATNQGPDLEEQDTFKHLEQSEALLRSIRNVTVSDTDDDVDVSYDKELSRKLLIENIVLRRDAEMRAKYPTKALLTDLEPLLIDIANLPDRAKPEDVRVIKERVEKTEIVAALIDYQGRASDNRNDR
jgi:hypothetical protein